jgi:hypothetical protein
MPMLLYSKDVFTSTDSLLFKTDLNCDSTCWSSQMDGSMAGSCTITTTHSSRNHSLSFDDSAAVVAAVATFQEENESSLSAASKRPCLNNNDSGDRNVRRRVVCSARGLSKDHNCDTAFFEIPSDAPHGLLLICSHPKCISAGVRFRYCKGTLIQLLCRCCSLGTQSGLFSW